MKVSADVGNSSTKLIVVDGAGTKARKQPTVVSYLPVVPQFEDAEVKELVANLHKNMIVHITSIGIERGGLFAVGDMANLMGGTGFNIKSHRKAERDLTLIQPLAMIAVTAVQNAYDEAGALPESLTLNVEYASAIPVVDYSKAAAKALEERWGGKHQVIVYVGESLQVPVTVNVEAAKVVQEGIPAFYALLEGSEEMFMQYNMRYDVAFSGGDFAKRKLLFCDIGDGTEELITVIDGVPVVKKSGGHRAGVGHASEKALVSFKQEYKFNAELTRSNFMQKVLDTNDKWHLEAKRALDYAMYEQQNKIYDSIVDHIENVLQSDIDDIIVCGGGTNVFKELEDKLVEYADQYKMRVLWIEGKTSSLLNAIGTSVLNEKVFFKKK